MSFDVWRRAAFQLAVSSALVLSSAALASAVCETVVIPPTDPPESVVGSGCHFMLVKMWGNGGNAGNPGLGWYEFRGRGGGGATLTAFYEVEEGQHFRAVVREPYGTGPSWQAFATALYEVPPTGPHYRMLIAGAGGGGGNQVTGGERPDGGAGGEVGSADIRATFTSSRIFSVNGHAASRSRALTCPPSMIFIV